MDHTQQLLLDHLATIHGLFDLEQETPLGVLIAHGLAHGEETNWAIRTAERLERWQPLAWHYKDNA